MVDRSVTSTLTENLRETPKRLLKLVAGMGGLNVPQNAVFSRFDKSRQALSRTVNTLVDKELLEKNKDGKQIFLNLTNNSLPFIFDKSPNEIRGGHGIHKVYTSNKVTDKGDLEDGMVRVHNVIVSFEFQDQYDIREKKEEWVKAELFNWEYSDEEDRYIGYKSGNQVRVCRSKVFFHLGDKVGWDIDELKADLISDAFDIAFKFEDESGINLKRGDGMGLKITVEKQHIALVGEPLGRYIDEETSMDINNFKVRADDGSVIYEWDKSKGVVEVESKNWAFSEEAIRNLRDLWRVVGEYGFNPQELESLDDLYKVVSKIKGGLDVLKGEFERQSKRTNKVEELLARETSQSKSKNKVGGRGDKGGRDGSGVTEWSERELTKFRNNYF